MNLDFEPTDAPSALYVEKQKAEIRQIIDVLYSGEVFLEMMRRLAEDD